MRAMEVHGRDDGNCCRIRGPFLQFGSRYDYSVVQERNLITLYGTFTLHGISVTSRVERTSSCQHRSAGPEHGIQTEPGAERAKDDGHCDLRELVHRQSQAEGFAGPSRRRIVVRQRNGERLTTAKTKPHQEGKCSQNYWRMKHWEREIGNCRQQIGRAHV